MLHINPMGGVFICLSIDTQAQGTFNLTSHETEIRLRCNSWLIRRLLQAHWIRSKMAHRKWEACWQFEPRIYKEVTSSLTMRPMS